MNRRGFNRLCAGLAAAATVPGAVGAAAPRTEHNRVRLVNTDGASLTAADVTQRESWVCLYPYVTSPCFVLNLGPTDSGKAPHPFALHSDFSTDATLVAFAAICTHKLSHPAKAMSFITYRPPTVEAPIHRIICCSEGSVYDAAQGARVLGGPAPAPLAAVELEEDSTGALFATASYAGDLYERFFDAFAFRLALDYEIENPRTKSENTATVRTMAEHSEHHIECF